MTDWFKPRRYKHFDCPVNVAFAEKVVNPVFVERHSFAPLLHYNKETKSYKKNLKKNVVKNRPIMYASHKDACILSFYSNQLNDRLNGFYADHNLSESAIAYRALGLGNYDFSADAYKFASAKAPVMILAFDVTGFFDNLDHQLLKYRLKSILGVASLTADWLKVFRFVTRYHYVRLDELKAVPALEARLKDNKSDMIATVAELKKMGISFNPNAKGNAGILQGTPISASLSNLYMMDFDLAAKALCDEIGALYRRYSDDILIVCRSDDASVVEAEVSRLIMKDKLELSVEKTERTHYDPRDPLLKGTRAAQYLGFNFYQDGAGIRPSSLSRQWRKMRKAIKKTRYAAEQAIASGAADRVYTKRLRKRFLPIYDVKRRRLLRNFSSYANRSADAFGSDVIRKQSKRLERAFERELDELKKIAPPPSGAL